MIDRHYRAYVVTCDRCGKCLPGQDSWGSALKSAANAGWDSRRNGTDWLDICPACLFEEKGSEDARTE